MSARNRKGMLGVSGVAAALKADEVPRRPNQEKSDDLDAMAGPSYRGKSRAPGSALRTLSVTLPANLVLQADAFVLDRKQSVPSYNRSALIEEALRRFLSAREKP